jgi:lipid-binding SYLF domain-containing protein
MATRYSKRRFDGAIEHYDSLEEMEAANPEIPLSSVAKNILSAFNPFTALIGFVVAGVTAISLLSHQDAWPTWVKFIAVLLSSGVVGWVAGKIGNAFIFLAIAAIGIAAVGSIGALVWRLL